MKFILIIFLSCFILGCVMIKAESYNRDRLLQKELLNKNIGEILSILKKMVMLDMLLNRLALFLVFLFYLEKN